MAFTRADLRDVCREEITVDPDGNVWSDNKLNQYINRAHRKLQKDLDLAFPDNENKSYDVSADGSLEYDWPTALGQIRLVKIGNQVLDPTTKDELLKRSQLNTAGNPSKYYILGGKIGFDLKPGSGTTITIYFYEFDVDFSDDTTASGLPDTDEVKLALAYYVKYLAWKKQKNQRETALSAKEDYQEALKEIREEYWGFQDRSFNIDRVPRGSNDITNNAAFI